MVGGLKIKEDKSPTKKVKLTTKNICKQSKLVPLDSNLGSNLKIQTNIKNSDQKIKTTRLVLSKNANETLSKKIIKEKKTKIIKDKKDKVIKEKKDKVIKEKKDKVIKEKKVKVIKEKKARVTKARVIKEKIVKEKKEKVAKEKKVRVVKEKKSKKVLDEVDELFASIKTKKYRVKRRYNGRTYKNNNNNNDGNNDGNDNNNGIYKKRYRRQWSEPETSNYFYYISPQKVLDDMKQVREDPSSLDQYGEIYCIMNRKTGYKYIGQTKCMHKVGEKYVYKGFKCRYDKHMKLALKPDNVDCPKFYTSIRKHGTSMFFVFLLERCLLKDMNSKEIMYIRHYKSRTFGYNVTRGGQFFKQRYLRKRKVYNYH